MIVVLV